MHVHTHFACMMKVITHAHFTQFGPVRILYLQSDWSGPKNIHNHYHNLSPLPYSWWLQYMGQYLHESNVLSKCYVVLYRSTELNQPFHLLTSIRVNTTQVDIYSQALMHFQKSTSSTIIYYLFTMTFMWPLMSTYLYDASMSESSAMTPAYYAFYFTYYNYA